MGNQAATFGGRAVRNNKHLKQIDGLELETTWRSCLPVNRGEGFSHHLDHRGIAGY